MIKQTLKTVAKMLAIMLIFGVICTGTLAEPSVHTIRIRFPGPYSDKIISPKPVNQETATYPAAGFKPEPGFELPELTYLPPTDPELNSDPLDEVYGPPTTLELAYSPPEPESSYGPPDIIYGSPDNTYEPTQSNNFQSATIVNAPLTHPTQFTPPRPNKAVHFRPFRPQAAAIVNAPLRPVTHLTLPRLQRFTAFRPRRLSAHSQQFYPNTYLTLPYAERLIEFRPRRVPNQQQSNFFSRPLPSSIFGKSNNGHFGRQLPSKIFSN